MSEKRPGFSPGSLHHGRGVLGYKSSDLLETKEPRKYVVEFD